MNEIKRYRLQNQIEIAVLKQDKYAFDAAISQLKSSDREMRAFLYELLEDHRDPVVKAWYDEYLLREAVAEASGLVGSKEGSQSRINEVEEEIYRLSKEVNLKTKHYFPAYKGLLQFISKHKLGPRLSESSHGLLKRIWLTNFVNAHQFSYGANKKAYARLIKHLLDAAPSDMSPEVKDFLVRNKDKLRGAFTQCSEATKEKIRDQINNNTDSAFNDVIQHRNNPLSKNHGKADTRTQRFFRRKSGANKRGDEKIPFSPSKRHESKPALSEIRQKYQETDGVDHDLDLLDF